MTTLNRWPPQAGLKDVGLKEIEAISCGSPKWVPQMVNNRELICRMEATIKAAIDRVWGGDQMAGGAATAPAAMSLAS